MKTKAHCIVALMLALAAFTACSGKKTHADETPDALIEAANYIAEAKRGAEAESRLRALFGFEECPSKEIAITDRGTFESQYIKDTDYSVCWGFSVEGLEGIDSFLYYPPEDNKVHTFMGKFEINGQEFTYSGRGFYWDFLPGLTVRSVDFWGRTFLLLLGGIGKYGDKVCFMFDITNPGRIVFYPPENRFVCKELAGNFFGPYQGRLCFFLSARRFDWNGQYRLSPYFADGGALKELRDENGKPYFVDYAFTTKYEQEFVIEGMNVPKNSASQKSRWKLRLAARCENRFRR